MFWSKGSTCGSNVAVKSRKCTVSLQRQRHINREGQAEPQPRRHSDGSGCEVQKADGTKMRRVRRKGANKEKVFGCDLLEHLNASSQEGEWTLHDTIKWPTLHDTIKWSRRGKIFSSWTFYSLRGHKEGGYYDSDITLLIVLWVWGHIWSHSIYLWVVFLKHNWRKTNVTVTMVNQQFRQFKIKYKLPVTLKNSGQVRIMERKTKLKPINS